MFLEFIRFYLIAFQLNWDTIPRLMKLYPLKSLFHLLVYIVDVRS